MNLYRISIPDQVVTYGMYDSAIVAAETDEAARLIHPATDGYQDGTWAGKYVDGKWADDFSQVTVEFIGFAKPGTVEGVLLASFNDG